VFFFNHYNYHWAQAAQEKVARLRERHPHHTNRQLAWLLITERAKLCGVVGAITALPAVFPGLGTLIAILGGVAVDVMVLSVVIYRLVLELSVVYGKNPLSPQVQKEALKIFSMAAGVDALGKKAARYTAQHLSRQAAATGLNRPLFYLGLRASQRSALGRLLPLLGVAVAGGISFLFARAVGKRTLQHFESTTDAGHHSWKGRTLDAEYQVRS
jgi:hypothetical protein